MVTSAVMDIAGWSCDIELSAAKVPVASESARFLLRVPTTEDLSAVGDVAPLLLATF